MSDFEHDMVATVDNHGWMVMKVGPRAESDEVAEWWAYTIGLSKTFGWPELICFGLDNNLSGFILNDCVNELRRLAIKPEAGIILENVLKDYDVKLAIPFPMATHYVSSAIWFAQHAGLDAPPSIIQVLWPDRHGVFPDEPRCIDKVRRDQTPLEVE